MSAYGGLDDPADHDAVRDVILQSFAFRPAPGQTPQDAFAAYRDRVGRQNFRYWRMDGRVVAGLCTYPMAQWFGGRAVPMHGVAAVGVAPEHRGKGAGKGLMTALLRELRATGVPLATLYASTQGLYRAVGFEQAGTWFQHEVSARDLTPGDRKLPVVQVSPDSPALRQSQADAARRSSGNVARPESLWTRLFEGASAFVFGTEADPEGHLVFAQERMGVAPVFTIDVRDVAANTPAAVGRLWTFLADHRSVALAVHWPGPGLDPMTAVLAEHRVSVVKQERWMLRVLDVAGALGQRGYHPHVVEELHLEVRDPLFEENQGRFVLAVSDGRGRVASGGKGRLVLDVRALAPLFTGLYSASALARIGWVRGGDAVLGVADRVFAGPEPWMADRF